MATSQAFQNLIVTVAPGERIFSEGEVGTTMFIVQSGRVLLYRESGGRKVPIAEMEKGDFFGEMSLLEGTPRNMSAEPIEACELIEINSTTFDRMIRSNVEIGVRLLRKLSGRLQKAESLIVNQRSQISTLQASALSAAAASASAAASAGKSASVSGMSARTTVVGEPAAHPAAAAAHATTAVTAAPRPAVAGAAPRSGSISATHPPSPSINQAARSGVSSVPIRGSQPKIATRQGPRLVSESGDTVFPLSTSDALVGRYDPVTETQPEVDLTLLDIKRSVSRRHARITLRDGSYCIIEEVGALNGTFVNGAKLVTGKPTPLKDEDRIGLGTVQLVFRA